MMSFSWPWFGSSRSSGAEPDYQEIRIVLIGQAGIEKSTARDIILGKKESDGTATTSCQLGIREWEGRRVVVIDAPASVYKEDHRASSEIQHLLDLSRPGPHALVHVASLRDDEDARAKEFIQKVFGLKAMEGTITICAAEDTSDSVAVGQHAQKNTQLYMTDLISGQQRLQADQLLSNVVEIMKKNKDRPLGASEKAKSPGQTQGESEALKEAAVPSTALPTDPERLALTPHEPELRIILVGKTGAGKSATGNTLLGEERFDSRFEFTPVTKSCQLGIVGWKRKRIVVIDTPAIFSPGAAEGSPEISQCRRLSFPGPHALVLVTQMGRFTEEDLQSARQVKEIFGKNTQDYMIVVFTRREDLRSESLEGYVGHTDNKLLQKVIRVCSNRYCGFNNSETGAERGKQAEELLSKIEEMVRKNQDRPYCPIKLDKGSETKSSHRKHAPGAEGTSV